MKIESVHKKFIADIISDKVRDLDSFIETYIETDNGIFESNDSYKKIEFRSGTGIKIVKDYYRAIELASEFNALLVYLKEHFVVQLRKELYAPKQKILLCERKTNVKPIPFRKFYDIFPNDVLYSAIIDNGLTLFRKHGYRTNEQYKEIIKARNTIIRTIVAVITLFVAVTTILLNYKCSDEDKSTKQTNVLDTLDLAKSNVMLESATDTTQADTSHELQKLYKY